MTQSKSIVVILLEDVGITILIHIPKGNAAVAKMILEAVLIGRFGAIDSCFASGGLSKTESFWERNSSGSKKQLFNHKAIHLSEVNFHENQAF